MIAVELISLVQDVISKHCEMQNVELKAGEKGCPKLYDTISAFANQSNGGIIILGVDQDDDYRICGVYDPQDIQVKITEQANQMSPVVRPLFTVAEYDGKIVVAAEIAECDLFSKPCFYKGAGIVRGSYIRVGDADLHMTEYEIYSYEAFRKKQNDELRSIERAGIETLDNAAIEVYKINIRSQKQNLAGLPDNQIYELQGVLNSGTATLTGLLLFGIYPQAFLPQLCITAVVIPGIKMGETGTDGERFIDNKKIEGRIPQMLDEALAFVQRNIKNTTIIKDDGGRYDKVEYPLKAIRELILNALVHRDYSIFTETSPVRIMIFRDRIEIESPGGLYGRLTIDSLGKVGGDTRNPYIAGAMEVLMKTENRFSGIPTVRLEMQKHGLPAPKFENLRGAFKVTLYNNTENPAPDVAEVGWDDPTQRIVDFCAIARTRKELSAQFGFASSSYFIKRYVTPLVDKNILRLTNPESPKSKNQKYVAEKK
ncbi:MAG: ATP-binding protein [Cloacibacillus sp.]